jgi:Kef-type K+ transport system membrane component KefB
VLLLADPGGVDIARLFLAIAAILAGAKLLGELAERIGQPAVLGELVAGVLLGGSVLGVVPADGPAADVIHVLAQLGVLLLLFEIGLETDLREMFRVGPASLAVALVGVAVPFALGYGYWVYVPHPASGLGDVHTAGLFIGATLTATSVGITARVLSDLGRLQEPESQVVLGAAVIDDIVGLIILGVISRLVEGGSATVWSIASITLTAFGFVVVALLVWRIVVPPLFRLLARLGREDTLGTMALALAFVTAVLADRVGSALIIGAFTMGLAFAPTAHARPIERGVTRLGHFFVPIFFVTVGAAVDVRTFTDPHVLLVGSLLIVVAIAGKVAAGFAPFWFKGRKLIVGVGMVPRGEVGLIFAQMGLASGVLDVGLFSAITLMVMVTTFVAPPALKALLGPGGSPAGRVESAGATQLTTEA